MTFAIIALVLISLGALTFEALRTPAGIERERYVKDGRIFTRTRTQTRATPEEFIRLLQTDWSWWRRARAEPMRDLGNGRRAFVFHPLGFALLEFPTSLQIRLDGVEALPDGGRRIPATLTGDFEGRAEYTAWPAEGGSIVELAWCDVAVKGIWRYNPAFMVGAGHHWRERLGIEGLRDRLNAGTRTAGPERVARSA